MYIVVSLNIVLSSIILHVMALNASRWHCLRGLPCMCFSKQDERPSKRDISSITCKGETSYI